MTQQNLTYDEIVSLINAFEASSEFNRFHLRYLDLELELEKKGALSLEGSAHWRGVNREKAHPEVQRDELEPKVSPAKSYESVKSPVPKSSKAMESASSHEAEGLLKVISPIVGTFYASPEPGAAAFVTVGQRVEENTQVCIIEVMKLMSSIEAGVKGTIREVTVKNNEPVEFGQVLFWVQPD